MSLRFPRKLEETNTPVSTDDDWTVNESRSHPGRYYRKHKRSGKREWCTPGTFKKLPTLSALKPNSSCRDAFQFPLTFWEKRENKVDESDLLDSMKKSNKNISAYTATMDSMASLGGIPPDPTQTSIQCELPGASRYKEDYPGHTSLAKPHEQTESQKRDFAGTRMREQLKDEGYTTPVETHYASRYKQEFHQLDYAKREPIVPAQDQHETTRGMKFEGGTAYKEQFPKPDKPWKKPFRATRPPSPDRLRRAKFDDSTRYKEDFERKEGGRQEAWKPEERRGVTGADFYQGTTQYEDDFLRRQIPKWAIAEPRQYQHAPKSKIKGARENPDDPNAVSYVYGPSRQWDTQHNDDYPNPKKHASVPRLQKNSAAKYKMPIDHEPRAG